MSGKSGRSASVVSTLVQKNYAFDQEEKPKDAVQAELQARTRPVMLVVVLKNGDELLLPYALLRHARKYEGGRKWKLVYDDFTIVLTGRNVGDLLREKLRMQQLAFLREGNAIEDDLTDEGETFIESIEIDMKEDA